MGEQRSLPSILASTDEIVAAYERDRAEYPEPYEVLTENGPRRQEAPTPHAVEAYQRAWGPAFDVELLQRLAPVPCRTCGGGGVIPNWAATETATQADRQFFWAASYAEDFGWMVTPCPRCAAVGKTPVRLTRPVGDSCSACRGDGLLPNWAAGIAISGSALGLAYDIHRDVQWEPTACCVCGGWGCTPRGNSVGAAPVGDRQEKAEPIEYDANNNLLSDGPKCVREGRSWRIAFGNKVYSSDSVGIRRIVILLQHKGHDVSTLVLRACGCLPIDKRAEEIKGLDLGEHDSGAADESDDRLNEDKDELRSARDVYLLGQAQAESDLAIACDEKEIARLNKLIAQTKKTIREYDAALRDRHSSSSHRTKAHRAIAKSIEREMVVMQEKHVELMAHLDSKAIKLGTKWCCYSPRVDIQWSIRE